MLLNKSHIEVTFLSSWVGLSLRLYYKIISSLKIYNYWLRIIIIRTFGLEFITRR